MNVLKQKPQNKTNLRLSRLLSLILLPSQPVPLTSLFCSGQLSRLLQQHQKFFFFSFFDFRMTVFSGLGINVTDLSSTLPREAPAAEIPAQDLFIYV